MNLLFLIANLWWITGMIVEDFWKGILFFLVGTFYFFWSITTGGKK